MDSRKVIGRSALGGDRMAALQILFFGGPDVNLEGGKAADLRSAKARALLAYLTVESNQAHRREKLIDLLWPDYTESSARANLRRALADLRQAIGDHQAEPPYLHISRETLQFNTASDAWVDVIAFSALLGIKLPINPSLSPNYSMGIDQLEEAIRIYRGPFLEGFSIPDSASFEEWSLLTRERFQRQALQTLNQLAQAYQEEGEYERALPYAWRQVEMDPWQESGHRQVMRLLALSGQRGAALAQYEACRQLMQNELGTSPSEQTQKLYNLLRQGEWPLTKTELPIRIARTLSECPYRGLSAFQEKDAPFFFGREEFITRLTKAVQGSTNTNVVVGASGSGKSSVVFAGLLPKLRDEEDWLITHFRPGRNPFQSLAAALIPLIEPNLSETDHLIEAQKMAEALHAREILLSDVVGRLLKLHLPATCLFLVVDQFEEIYTFCTEPGMRESFLDLLMGIKRDNTQSNMKFLLTLRADFLSSALSYRPFTDLLQTGTLMLGPMTQEEMRAAIEKPGEEQGAAFDPGLVDRILDDVGEEPGNLPLLEFALLLLWEGQTSGWLTHSAYEAIDQVEGALTCYAEQVFRGLDKPVQDKIRHIFMQLVRPGEGTEDTRRMATRAEIGESNWPLTQLLADKRLVVTSREASTGNETAEIAHEALILKWERLRLWMEADRAFRSWQEGLRVGIRQWQESERDEGALLRGTPLGQAESWLAERGGELSEAEIEYIQASIYQRESKEREHEAQRQRELTTERKSRRLMGALAGVLSLAVVVALALFLYSFRQQQKALQAYSLSMTANARNALDERDTATGLALALAANQIENPPLEAQRTLLDAAYSPGARWRADVPMLFSGMKGSVVTLDISPDGQRILSGFSDGALILWDLNTKEEILRLQGHTGRVNDVAISPDGLLALSGGDDRQVILWDLTSGEPINYLDAHTGIVRAVDFSPDGNLAVTGGFAAEGMLAPGELILWDQATGEEIHRFTGHVSGIVAAQFTPDGNALLASSGDTEIFSDQLSDESLDLGTAPFDLILWDVLTGTSIRRFEGSQDDAFNLAISPDGTRALAGSYYNNLIALWDLENGQRLLNLTGHTEGVYTVSFSPDGQRALTGSYDDNLMLWDLNTGQLLAVLKAHGSDVLDLVFTPDGRTALSSARDGGLILWDLFDAAQVQQLAGHGDMVYDVAFTPDGKQALSSSGSSAPSVPVKDASIRLWDLETGEQIRNQAIAANVIFQVAISPNGRTALLASDQPDVIVWDLTSWRELGRMKGHHAAITSIEFALEGQRALSLGVDGTLILWDVPNRQAIRMINNLGQGLWSLSISPDGRTALTDSGNSSMILWDLEAGKKMRSFMRDDPPEEPGSSGMAFLPDGSKAISCEHDGYLIEWDLETGNEIRRLGMHPSLRTRVAVSSDGSLALSSGMDGSLMLWDLKTGELVRRSGGHGIIFDLALSPDSRTALFGTSDTMIYHWRLGNPSLSELQNWIKTNRYVRDLSCEEMSLLQIEPENGERCSP
jgi:WD40 repeat protein/DNA-binding SARP family transcriptional activator